LTTRNQDLEEIEGGDPLDSNFRDISTPDDQSDKEEEKTPRPPKYEFEWMFLICVVFTACLEDKSL